MEIPSIGSAYVYLGQPGACGTAWAFVAAKGGDLLAFKC